MLKNNRANKNDNRENGNLLNDDNAESASSTMQRRHMSVMASEFTGKSTICWKACSCW